MQSLRRLDERVIGTHRTSKREQARRTFVLGLGGCTVVLALALGFRRPALLSGMGGFAGVTIGGAVRWWNAPADDEEQTRSRRLLTSLALLVLGGVIASLVTMGRWGASTDTSRQPQVDLYRRTATMVVLCVQTERGDAYTYQAPATEVPRCKNGAVPQVVVRG